MKLIQRAARYLLSKAYSDPLEAAQAMGFYDPVKQQLMLQHYGPNNPEAIYKKMWIANRCVNIIAAGIVSLPISVVDVATDEEDDENPIIDLLRNPNFLDTFIDLLTRVSNDYHLRGNAYLYVTDPTLNPAVTELIPLFPQITTPADARGNALAQNFGRGEEIKYFAGFVNDETGEFYPKEQVINFKSYNPHHRILGLSAFEPADSIFQFLDRVSRFKVNLYDNQATPSGYMKVPPDVNVTLEEQAKIQKELSEKWTGVVNSSIMRALFNGLEYVPISWSPKDAQLTESENGAAAQVATTLGVPSELLGDVGEKKNMAVYVEASKAFYRWKVFPLGNLFYAAMSKFFFPKGDKKIKFSIEEIDLFRPKMEELPPGMSLRQILSAMGQKTNEEPGEIDPLFDNIFIPSSLIPAEEQLVKPQEAPVEM